MPTFICHDCGAIDNTALTHYWSRTAKGQPALCSKCLTGEWHNQFPRQHWSELGIKRVLELQKLGRGDMINAKEHLRNIGVIGSKHSVYEEIKW